MLQDLIGIFGPYGQLNKPLDDFSRLWTLNSKERLHVPLVPFDSLIQFNSTYLEMADKAFATRGILTSLIGAPVLLCIVMTLVFWPPAISRYLSSDQVNWSDFGLALFFTISFGAMGYTLYQFLLKRELRGSTHYPIRFNRETQMVYFIDRDGSFVSAPWSDWFVAVMGIGGDKSDLLYNVRLNLLDEQQVITANIGLPYSANLLKSKEGYSPILYFQAQWEFVRRYMEEGVEDSWQAAGPLIPIAHRRERPWEGIRRLVNRWEQFRIDLSPTQAKPIPNSWLAQAVFSFMGGATLIVFLLAFLGRLVVMRVAKRPVWPKWVEAECTIDPNDPYDLEARPKPKVHSSPYALWQRVISWGLFMVGAYICVLYTVGLAAGKLGSTGSDVSWFSQLLIWNWF